jgi:hypothetical protein
MALSVNRFTFPNSSSPWSISGLWVAAGLAMLVLSGCTFFLLPEESFAIASALLILLLAAADLRCGFLAFVLLYPFMPASWGIDIAEWMPYFTAKRLCCLVLTLVFLIAGKGAWDTPRVRRVGWFVVALVLVQMVAGFGSRDPLGAVRRTFGDAVEWYMPFLIAAHLFRTRAQVKTLITLALVSMGVAALLAVIEHGIDYNFYDTFTAARADIQALLTRATESHRDGDITARRVRVAFHHPIELGLHLMCMLILCTFALRQRGPFYKIGLMGGIPLFLLALLYTYSRGPLLGLVCGLVWLALIGRNTRSLLPVLVVSGIMVYVLMPSAAREVLDRTIATSTDIETDKSVGGGTVRARLNLLEAGLKYTQQNLWFGLGPGELSQQKVSAGRGEMVDFASVDNFYLQVQLRHGLITLVMTIGFYLYLLGMFTRGAFRLTDRDASVLVAAAAAICVANFVALATVGINITLFWILLGPAVRTCDLYQPSSRRRGSPQKPTDRENDSMLASRTEPKRPAERTPVAAGRFAVSRKSTLCLRNSVLIICLLAAPVTTHAASSFYGTTGLFATPSAAIAPRGAWSASANYVSRDFRPGAASYSKGTVAHSLALTLLPRVEVAAVLNNWEGKLGAQRLNAGPSQDFDLAGYNTDRMIAVHWQAMRGEGSRPSVAIGVRDLFGTSQPLRSQYAVASWALASRASDRALTLSAGLGTRHLGGLFGGVEYQVERRATLVCEAQRGQVNGGVRLVPFKNVQIDAAAMSFRSFGGGLSYRRKF